MLCCHGVLRNNGDVCPQCREGYSPYPNCSDRIDDRLDPSSNCTQCKSVEPDCYVSLLICTTENGDFLALHFYFKCLFNSEC